MVGIRAGMRHTSTSLMIINTLSIIVKVIVAYILTSTSTSCTVTPTISSLKFGYTQQYTMVTCVVGLGVAGMVPIYTSYIINNSLSHISIGKVAGLFISSSTSAIIKSFIPPWVTIIKTYISPPSIIIITYITLLSFMNLFLYTTRWNWQSQQFNTFTWVMEGRVAGMRPISTSTFNINYCSLIAIGIVDGLLWPRSTSTNITTMISFAIICGRLAGLKRTMSTTSSIAWGIVSGLKRYISTYFFTQRHLNTFLSVNFIVVVATVEVRMAGFMRPIY